MPATGTGWRRTCGATSTSSRPTCAGTAIRSGRSAAATRWSTTPSTSISCCARSTSRRSPSSAIRSAARSRCSTPATYPDRVKKVVAIEGLGPPPEMLREQPPAHQRMRVWIGEMRALARRHPHRYATLDEAVERMQDANPRLTPAQARHLTVYGSYRDEDGTYLWKFDNYVRAISPYLFNMTDAFDIWTQITCPVAAAARHRVVGLRPRDRRPRQGLHATTRSSTSRRPATGCTTTSWRSS